MTNNSCMETLPALLESAAKARNSQNWPKLEEISIEVLRLAYKGSPVDEQSLKSIIQSYLASIIGSGEFLTDLQSQNSRKYQEGLSKLLEFLKKRPHYFESSAELIQSAQEIVLLSLDPITANRNKIGKLLRNLARPDVSIQICRQILDASRLNYYSLTVICGAYCDLGQFDKAIEAAEIALKHSPEASRTYPLTSLVRAHTLKFKSTGDISEIDTALDYGHRALSLRVDSYAANAFVAAAVASGNADEIAFAQEMLGKAEPELRKADIAALFQAYQAKQALAPEAEIVEVIDEYDDEYFATGDFDTLFDLVEAEQVFRPIVPDKRNMLALFVKGGWFFQGLSYVPCPDCKIVAVHAYRKHFVRYGKSMHYWALVCSHCKYATDSVDFEKSSFTLISRDLQERFPVADLCSDCT